MGTKIGLFVFGLAIYTLPLAEGLFSASWMKAPSERATTLAIDRNSRKFYVSYLDLTKDKDSVGKILAATIDDHDVAQLDQLPLPIDTIPLISPIAIRTDKCNNLWILDSGVRNISGVQDKSSLPSIQAIHLRGKQVLIKHQIPEEVVSKTSFLTSFAIDTQGKCEEANIYIADFNRPALIAFYSKTNNFEHYMHHYFNPDPVVPVTDEIIFNKHHRDVSGIFGLDIVKDKLLFHPLASKHEFSIDLQLLRSMPYNISYYQISVAFDRPHTAGAMVHVPEHSVTFFAQSDSIGCIGSQKIYKELILGKNFSSGHITDLSVNGTSLWVLVNTKNKYFVEELNIKELIKGTHCDDNGLGPRAGLQNSGHSIVNKALYLIVMTLIGLRCLD